MSRIFDQTLKSSLYVVHKDHAAGIERGGKSKHLSEGVLRYASQNKLFALTASSTPRTSPC